MKINKNILFICLSFFSFYSQASGILCKVTKVHLPQYFGERLEAYDFSEGAVNKSESYIYIQTDGSELSIGSVYFPRDYKNDIVRGTFMDEFYEVILDPKDQSLYSFTIRPGFNPQLIELAAIYKIASIDKVIAEATCD